MQLRAYQRQRQRNRADLRIDELAAATEGFLEDVAARMYARLVLGDLSLTQQPRHMGVVMVLTSIKHEFERAEG